MLLKIRFKYKKNLFFMKRSLHMYEKKYTDLNNFITL